MITLEQYFGHKISHPAATEAMQENARDLLLKVNGLLTEACEQGVYSWEIDPDTGTCISGSKGGAGDGGFRLPDSKTGGPKSNHRSAHGVDVFDPNEQLEQFLNDSILQRHGLYREAPESTRGWVHLSDIPPGSGKRTFIP